MPLSPLLHRPAAGSHAVLPRYLAAAGIALALLAAALPPMAELAHQHAFADRRLWAGVPHAADVLSNLPFTALGAWGLSRWRRLDAAARAVRPAAPLVFIGLLSTAAGSALYHWQPEATGLLLDRAGMAVAFAGVLGLAAGERAGPLVGRATACCTLLFAAAALAASALGNVAPWAVLQFGGCALLATLALCRPTDAATAVRWSAVLAGYALAKAFEMGDHAVFDATGGALAGHTLKHLCAAAALWPVLQSLSIVGRHNAAAATPPTGAP